MLTSTILARALRRILASGALSAALMLSTTDAAIAMPIDFVFSLTKPLVHGTETIGGPLSPVLFQFRVDSETPDLNGSSTNSIYPLEYGRVQIGLETSQALGGLITVQKSSLGAGLIATANGGDDGTVLNGRSLFVSHVSIFDFSGSMLANTDLPLNSEFAASTGFGMFRLTFRPLVSDPEYLTGGYVIFDAFPVTASDFSLTRISSTPIPEPTAVGLLVISLMVTGLFKQNSYRSRHYDPPLGQRQ